MAKHRAAGSASSSSGGYSVSGVISDRIRAQDRVTQEARSGDRDRDSSNNDRNSNP